MFFLIRMAFWIGLILLILPIGLTSDGGRQVGAFEAFGAVQAAISDARGFCQRQPEACAVGGEMLSHITDKAQAGARWVYETIGAQKGEHSPALPEPAQQNAAQPAPHGLTPQDLSPAWSGEPAAPAAPAPGMPLPPRRPA
ncbi:hypothetical protein GCM10007301_10460 [Azorhizobium oxalatiphilum]|uniref:DUF5330 domain-containing protein n=1 Tax=Azorhizobium oxalatiphilum TaxID=980631 RepID=A0A917F782_9HYPH|nr:DUF5330 domain-containing protein [Azorhizobium oxalatiphilum]GGF52868.1 hypothetical protein GCM10007301_10460 [Azorhizobium oxalatiphilum]